MESTSTSNTLFSEHQITKYFKDIPPSLKYGKDGKFTDESFPPNDHSLLGQDCKGNFIDPCEGESKAKDINTSKIEWKRASEIFKNHELLFDEKIECNDIKQGGLGNCYFLSAIAALTEYPKLIYKIFRTKESNPKGYYELVFFIDGQWQIVFVDDYFPVSKGTNDFVFAKPNGYELWVILLEKAWAKVNGGYPNCIRGWPSEAFAPLTGFATQRLDHSPEKHDELYKFFKAADLSDKIMCTTTVQDENIDKVGLASNHAYSLIGVKDKIHNGELIRLSKIRNPWGHMEWNGKWSDKSDCWTEELKEYFDKKEDDKDDGVFYMSFEDHMKYFRRSDVCNIMYDCNVKTFTVSDDAVKSPNVFNFFLKEETKLAISVIHQNWRYNREVKDADRPTTMVIAKYNEDTKTFSRVEGEFSSREDLEIVKTLKKGIYIVWIYCNYESCSPVKPPSYSVIFSSTGNFSVKSKDADKNFSLIRELIAAGVKIENKEKIETEEVLIVVKNSYGTTGIGYRYVNNKSTTSYRSLQIDASKIEGMTLFPPFRDQTKFEILVPSGGYAIVLGSRTRTNGTYWFNVSSTSKTLKCKAGEDPTNTHYPDLSSFTNCNTEDEHYDYISSSHFDAKIDLNFKHVDSNEVMIEDLKSQYPEIMKRLLALDINEGSNNSWIQMNYDNGYYVGQVNGTNRRDGKGAYHFTCNKTLFIGQWSNGVKSGVGSHMNDNFKIIYEGQYSNNNYHGKGKYYYDNGNTYFGDFVDGKRSGKGTLTWKNGSRWEGPFVKDELKGEGVFYDVKGKSRPYTY